MGEQELWSLEGAVQSYAHWWREAGFHTAIDPIAHGWRQAPAAPFWQREAAPASAAPAAPVAAPVAAPAPAGPAGPVAARQAEAPVQPLRRIDAPATLPAFLDWLAQDAGQPEAGWDAPLILPVLPAQPKLIVIVEMPGLNATDAETLVEPAQRRFIDAMLATLGLPAGETALIALATRRPPGGLLDEATLKTLSGRMTALLGLARPQALIVLGDRTSRALIGAQWSPNGEWPQKINHGGGTVDAIALAGPELLMSRPAAKAKSWQALRLLHGIVHQ